LEIGVGHGFELALWFLRRLTENAACDNRPMV
jgi:hypothetical protein